MTDSTISAPVLQRQVKVHGKNAVFVADPVGFILKNACTLAAEVDGGDGASGSYFASAYGTHSVTTKSKEYRANAGVSLTVELRVDSRMPAAHEIRVVPGGQGDKKVAFLPWTESGGTVTQLDTASELFLTGPLTGCHVYVAVEDGKQPWVFHLNDNTSADDRAANIKAKDTEADAIAAKHGTRITKSLKRGEYAVPAFVWGVRVGVEWSFYVHELEIPSLKPVNRPF